jgi:hypothetical protein
VECYAQKTPEVKVTIVRAETLKARTLYVGDGIKDASALMASATANHECSCIGGTDTYNGLRRVNRRITTCRLLKLEIVGRLYEGQPGHAGWSVEE